jgi:hypothetical protein
MIEGFFRLVEDIALRERIDPVWLAGKRTNPPLLARLRDEVIADALWRGFGSWDVMACLGWRNRVCLFEAAARGAAASAARRRPMNAARGRVWPKKKPTGGGRRPDARDAAQVRPEGCERG